MEILRQMTANMLSRGEVGPSLPPETMEYLGIRSFEILGQIRQIIANDELDDPECFQRIESIVCLLESNGIDCGTRHDFG